MIHVHEVVSLLDPLRDMCAESTLMESSSSSPPEARSFRLGLMDVLHASARERPSGIRGELQADVSGHGVCGGNHVRFPLGMMHLSI
jgi:hypothetical protein